MKSFTRIINQLLCREEGQTLSEYGIIIFFLVIVVVGAVTLLGENILSIWTEVAGLFEF